jgi:hypothetical protein
LIIAYYEVILQLFLNGLGKHYIEKGE